MRSCPPSQPTAPGHLWTLHLTRHLNCKVKRDGQGKLERFKVRLVAKGNHQEKGINVAETFAPVTKYSTVRALMAIAAAEDLKVHQLGIKTAFLQGKLDEEVYVQQTQGYQQGDSLSDSSKVLLLHKALYGLKQAAARAARMAQQTAQRPHQARLRGAAGRRRTVRLPSHSGAHVLACVRG